MTLSSEEYDLLNKIARKSKMDCWFSIRQTKKGDDYIYDLENGKRLSLATGIYQLMVGIEGMYDMYFNESEYVIIINLLLSLLTHGRKI